MKMPSYLQGNFVQPYENCSYVICRKVDVTLREVVWALKDNTTSSHSCKSPQILSRVSVAMWVGETMKL